MVVCGCVGEETQLYSLVARLPQNSACVIKVPKNVRVTTV